MKMLCFGDSNTYGYDPRSYFGSRYAPEHRWVDLLAKALNCTAVNAGENGREIPVRERELQNFSKLLTHQNPVDLLLIMLGGNDLLQGNSVRTTAQRMENFLQKILLDRRKIVLIAPPRMQRGTWVADEQLLNKCVQLGKAYADIAQKENIRFVDATDWDIEVTFDGVHYSEAGHRTFANELLFAIQHKEK